MLIVTQKICATHIRLIAACLALASANSVHAGASLLVDDATLTPVGRCQIETWARAYSHGKELTTVPACNYADTEFSLGISDFFEPGTSPLLNLGIKHLWRDFDQGSFGIGASAAATWNADTECMEFFSFSIPISVALDAQRNLLLHTNLGWLDTRGISSGFTAGVGIERIVTKKSELLAEFYAQYDHVHVAQLGLRHTMNDLIDIDVLVGHQEHVANGATFVTFGFNVLLR